MMGKLRCLNVGFGDTTLIETGSGVVLVDCNEAIADYRGYLPTSNRFRAVFVTHQHYDHFLGLRYLKNNGYSIDYLICSPYKRRYSDNSVEYDEWRTFQEFADYFVDRGTKIYRPYRQTDFGKPWWAPWGLKIWMLGPSKSIASSPTRELHDASLVFHIKMGSRKCLFTGDASDTSLKWIAGHTKNPCGDILHASHHGSINGADLDFIKKCKASYTVISTKAGVHSNVPHPTALARYKNHTSDEVYRTDKDGTLRWTF